MESEPQTCIPFTFELICLVEINSRIKTFPLNDRQYSKMAFAVDFVLCECSERINSFKFNTVVEFSSLIIPSESHLKSFNCKTIKFSSLTTNPGNTLRHKMQVLWIIWNRNSKLFGYHSNGKRHTVSKSVEPKRLRKKNKQRKTKRKLMETYEKWSI